MASFTPTTEQKMLIDTINKFAVNDARPTAHDADEASTLPVEVVRKGWEIGVLPAGLPEAHGGLGEYSAVTNALAAEEFAYGDLAVALAVMAPGLVGLPIQLSGTEEQQHNLLPALSEPAAPAFTAALLEPGISFKPSALKTTAARDGDQITLNGAKCYVPLAAEARMLLVYARDTETGKVDGYLVEGGTAGLTIGEREKLMGIRALPTYRVNLNGVRVDAACKLGGEAGTRYERLLSHSRVALASLAVGVARAAFEYARDYAKGRVQFGVPVATKQAIAFMLAEMAIEIDSARLLTWEAAWQLDRDPAANVTAESYLAKEYADKAVLTVTDGAVQALGGHGYIREHPVERWLRNARGFATFDGMAMI
jgi:alkylation response protein AidB-like acyl-CoA dehydrogenase